MLKYSMTLLLVLLVGCTGKNAPEDAVNGFLSALRDGDYEALLQHCPSLDAEIGDLTPSELAAELPAQPDLTWEITSSEVSINGETAVVQVDIDGNEMSYNCVQDSNGSWIVDEIENDSSSIAYENACRANMRTIASQEVIFYAEHGYYTESLHDLSLQGVECYEHGEYRITVDGDHVTISCPGNHGSIADGVCSWIR